MDDPELRRKLILGMACLLAAQKYAVRIGRDLDPDQVRQFITRLREEGCEFTDAALDDAEQELIKMGRLPPKP
jgi:hypothetical protein